MNHFSKPALFIFTVAYLLCLCCPVFADWMRMDPPPDVDKDSHGHNGTLTCWQATAANMLAGAGYGEGATVQERADAIYVQLTDNFGTANGGWAHVALKWWLRSEHNTLGTESVIKKYGNPKGAFPWKRSGGAELLANELRDGKLIGLGIRWPAWSIAVGTGGHAITLWGDSGDGNSAEGPPRRIFVTDSDRDDGGDVQTYTYDSYTSPNPGGASEGKGWYISFSPTPDHPYIKSAVTLEPLAVPRTYSMIHAAVISCRIHQDDIINPATDMHYGIRSDSEIIAFYSTIDWPEPSDVMVQEGGSPRNELTYDWDLSENPVPYCNWITATATIVKPIGSTLDIIDMHFTYPGVGPILPLVSWRVDTPAIPNPEEIPYIRGGYVVVSFDLVDPAGGEEPTVIAQYRLVNEYDYTQDPEVHQLTLSGAVGYQVANLKVGHSYGLPSEEELWEYNDWKTHYTKPLDLDSAIVDVDWENTLPYPDPEYYDTIPKGPDCTYYYIEDLNEDCEVNLHDLQMLAIKWLFSTAL